MHCGISTKQEMELLSRNLTSCYLCQSSTDLWWSIKKSKNQKNQTIDLIFWFFWFFYFMINYVLLYQKIKQIKKSKKFNWLFDFLIFLIFLSKTDTQRELYIDFLLIWLASLRNVWGEVHKLVCLKNLLNSNQRVFS